jgi:hypothetical protein
MGRASDRLNSGGWCATGLDRPTSTLFAGSLPRRWRRPTPRCRHAVMDEGGSDGPGDRIAFAVTLTAACPWPCLEPAHEGLRRAPNPRGKGQEIHHARSQALRRSRNLRRPDGRPAGSRGPLLASHRADAGRGLTGYRSVLNTHTSAAMAELVAARPWLTVYPAAGVDPLRWTP